MKRLFKSLFGLLFHPIVLTLLGLLLLSLLIYFIGPGIEIFGYQPLGDPWRWWLIALLWILWIGNLCRKALLAWYRDRQMQTELRARPRDTREADSRAEVAEMAARFDEALEDLRRHLKVRFGRRYLYQLPWYILIGPPASGKTTALSTLKNDELSFFRKVSGTEVSGTRNCDWFFTGEAVLIDTAGRLVTQDSDREIDQAGWKGFLELLKKFRRRRPINGVLVAMSAPDLLGNERHQTDLAYAIKARLQELHDELGIRVPLYVMVTKCDLLAGFNEFFDKLEATERTQVWGMTLPLDEKLRRSPEELLGQFESAYRGLRERLAERLLARLQDERNTVRRDRIFGFPQQFEGLYTPLQRFLQEIVQPNMIGEVPLLRGVYFTSGIQHGQPIDQLVYSLGQIFELQTPPPGESQGEKSYFVARLLRDVVFREAGLANTNLRWERHRLAFQTGTYALTLLVAVLIGLGWLYSYRNNLALIDDLQQTAPVLARRADAVPPDALEITAVAPVLDQARDLPAGYRERQEQSFLDHGLGLSQLPTLSDQGTLPAYQRLLGEGLVPRLQALLEDRLLGRGGSGGPDLFTTFQTYLVLTGQSPAFDRALVHRWWREMSNNPDWRAVADNHLEALLDGLQDTTDTEIFMQPDQALIEAVRSRLLTEYPPDALIYRRLREAPENRDIAAVDLGDELGRGASLDLTYGGEDGFILNTEVPGWFTRKAFPDHVPGPREILSQVGELWFLFDADEATGVSAETLVEQVRLRYLEEYTQQWQSILDNVGIPPLPTGDFEESASLLHRLGQPDSSLDRLFQTVARETALTVIPREDADADSRSLLDRLPGRVKNNRLARRLLDMVDNVSGTTDQENLQALVDRTVNQHFRALHEMVDGGRDEALLRTLEGLGDALDVYAASPSEQARESVEKAATSLQRQAQGLMPAIEKLIEPVVDDITIGVGEGEQNRLRALFNEAWRDQLHGFCQRAIANRYPLWAGETEEINIADFEYFFGAGSGMDQFFQQYLAEYVDRSHHPWSWDQRSGIEEPAISVQALRQFELASTIKERFFRGGAKLLLSFRIRADWLSATAASALLAVGGQTLEYAHGASGIRPRVMAWPDPERIDQVRLVLQPRAGIPLSLRHEGPWALFRLLEQADVGKQGQESYEVRFSLGGEGVIYILEPDSALHPFDLVLGGGGLGGFRCPDRL